MHRMMTLVVVVVAVASLGMGACGGDGGTALSQDEFVKQGNAICKAGTARIDAATEKAFANASAENPPSAAAIQAFAKDTGIPEIEKQIDELDKLTPPKDAQDKFDAALKEARTALDKVKADPAILLDDSSDAFQKSNELISGVGLTTCAE